MSALRDGNRFESTIVLILVAALGGCSRPGGFFVVPEHRDLGVIGEGRAAIAEFEIRNGLDRPVEVNHIYPSCTCTTVGLSENPIPPGESAILRATADLSQMAGTQKFSVLLMTDSPEFPSKRVSFTAIVPATGTHQRRLSIGSFYPGAEIDLQLPSSSFSRGEVELVEGSYDGDGYRVGTHLADGPDGQTMFAIRGTAPHAVGTFARKFQFQELIPEKPSLGEGIVELELVGRIVARWDVKRELYAGFVSLTKDGGTISLCVERNATSIPVTRRKHVTSVSMLFDEDWLSLKSQSASSDRIELELAIHEDKLNHLGAFQMAIELTIEYGDGDVESYSSCLFGHIEKKG